MPKLTLELEPALYRLLQQAAQGNRLSLQEECLRRLAGEARRSHYMTALLADLRADDQQQRARKGCP